MARCLLILTTLLAVAAAGAAAASDDIPRRPDGKPDLSGTYDIATLTPLMRPAQYGDNIESWLGESVDRWEGDTLVVTTKNFGNDYSFTHGSKDMVITERFSRMDNDALLYKFTVDDPNTWTEPWGGEYPWPASTNKVYEYACHEGNYALGGILRGARLLEEEALEGDAASTGGGGSE